MRILLTGATGYIGSHLLERLLEDGHEVAAVQRGSSTKLSDLSLRFEGQLKLIATDGSTNSLVAPIQTFRPELAYHLAANFIAEHKTSDIESLAQSNLTFGLQLLEALAVASCTKLVHAGTSWQNFTGDKYDPVCLYAATKEAFETLAGYYAAARGLNLTTAKLFDTYGPRDPRPKVLSLLVRAAKNGERLSMSGGKQLLELVYITDVVEALLLAGRRLCDGRDQGKTEYVVSTGAPVSLRELADIVFQAVGKAMDIEWGGRPYREREVMIPWKGGQRVPGWTPQMPLLEGITKVLASDV